MKRAVVPVFALAVASFGAARAHADEPTTPETTTPEAATPVTPTPVPATPVAPVPPPPPAAPATATPAAPAPTKPAVASRPAAPLFSLKDLDGKPISLTALRGKVVVVNFWATWCAPCMQELPFLDQFQQKRGKDGLVVIAIATDGPETAAGVASVVRRRRMTMRVAHDRSGTVIASLNPRAANPYTLFIDRQGRIAHHHEGYSPGDERAYEALIDALLAER